MRKRLVPLLVAAVGILSSCAPPGPEPASPGIVADFGGYPIEESLYRQEMGLQLYYVRIAFEQEYGVRLESDLKDWQAAYGQTTPLSVLKQQTLQAAARAKALLVLGAEDGILATDDFDKIREDYAGAFRQGPHREQLPGSPGERQYTAFTETLKRALKQSLREQADDSRIEAFIREVGPEYLNRYIRVSEAEMENPALLAGEIGGNAQKRGAILDLMQDFLLEKKIEEMQNANEIVIRPKLYEQILPDFGEFLE